MKFRTFSVRPSMQGGRTAASADWGLWLHFPYEAGLHDALKEAHGQLSLHTRETCVCPLSAGTTLQAPAYGGSAPEPNAKGIYPRSRDWLLGLSTASGNQMVRDPAWRILMEAAAVAEDAVETSPELARLDGDVPLPARALDEEAAQAIEGYLPPPAVQAALFPVSVIMQKEGEDFGKQRLRCDV